MSSDGAQADWRPAFGREVDELFRRRLRVVCIVLLVMHTVAVGLFEGPPPTGIALALQIGLFPTTAIVLGATWVPSLGRSLRVLSAILIATVSAYATWVNATTADPLDVRSITLCILTAGLLFPFTATATAVLSLTITGFYLAAALGSGHVDRQALVGGTFFVACAAALATLAASLGSRLRAREFRARFELEKANAQNEALLRNMLPGPIVERLKHGGGLVADRHAEATVMFIDIVGFTSMSSKVSPEELVRFLNELFSELDALTTGHGLEKIKTIGDAYMVAGGLPAPRDDHAEAIAALALEIRELVRHQATPDGAKLDVRIGIHTGPVVAGVIGVTKLTYDLWGDTVNTASRMESHGEPGVIQLSEATHARLEGKFAMEPRGTVPIKGKGPMAVYALNGPAGAG